MIRFILLFILVVEVTHTIAQTSPEDSLLISIKNNGCLDLEKVSLKVKDSTYIFFDIKKGEISSPKLLPYLWTNNHIQVWFNPPKPLFYSNKKGLQNGIFIQPTDYIGESKLTDGSYTIILKICKAKRKYTERQRRWKLERDIEKTNPNNS